MFGLDPDAKPGRNLGTGRLAEQGHLRRQARSNFRLHVMHQRQVREPGRAALAAPRPALRGVVLAPSGIDQAQFDRVEITGRTEADLLARQQAREGARRTQLPVELPQRLGKDSRRRLSGLRRGAQLFEDTHAQLEGLRALAALGIGEDRRGPGLARLELGPADHPAAEQARDTQHVNHAVAARTHRAELDERGPAFADPRARVRKYVGKGLVDAAQVAAALERHQARRLFGCQRPHGQGAFTPPR